MKYLISLLHDYRGAAMPLIAATVGVFVLAAGGAIDAGRAHLVEAKLSSSLDAAGLAAGSSVSTVNYQTEASKYFYANFPDGYLGANVTDLTVTMNEESTLISLSATATLDTTILRLAGLDQFEITVASEITRQSKGLELVLVVDNSGSMDNSAGGGLTRLEAAQDSIEILLNILYGSDDTQENLWVGVVPFSQAVNIGTSRTSWVNAGSHNWGPTSWAGCVEARFTNNRDITDDVPSTQKFNKYYYPCTESYDRNEWYGNNYYRNDCDNWGSWGYRGGISKTTYGPNLYCPNELTPLSTSKAAVIADVNVQTPIGGTHTNLGVVWAWRMLSPSWRGLWGGEMDTDNLPLDYGAENMEKAIIILSDGANQHVSWNYSAYDYLHEGNLGTTSSSWSDNRLDDRTEDVCDAMKDENIIIYTIAFGTSISSQGKALMQDCASKADYYFESPSPSDLNTAFQAIGDSLANLRVSK